MNFETHKHRPALDTDYSKSLGSELKLAREARKLSINDAADMLLLSRHQIMGLESGTTTFFYSSTLYAQAADKYAALLALKNRPSAALLASTENDSAPENNATPELPSNKLPTKWLLTALIALGCLIAVFFVWQNQSESNITINALRNLGQ